MTARVLWLTKGLGLGGAERLLTLTAARIDPTRFEVEVAYLLPWKDGFVLEREQAGMRTVCHGGRRGADPRWTLRLRRMLRTRNYAIVHTQSPVPVAAARLLARSPTRLMHTEHSVWDRYRRLTYVANALIYPRNDAVIAVPYGVADSTRCARWVPGRYPQVRTLLQGVEPDSAPRGFEARAAARRELDSQPIPIIGPASRCWESWTHACAQGSCRQAEGVGCPSPTKPSTSLTGWSRAPGGKIDHELGALSSFRCGLCPFSGDNQ